MSQSTTIVCFANSRKRGGRCIAGKEWCDGAPGGWIRPVGASPTRELSAGECHLNDGSEIKLLDIVGVPLGVHAGLPHQAENRTIVHDTTWSSSGSRLGWPELEPWLDSPATLWGVGQNSQGYRNNRIGDQYRGGKSLCLIRLNWLDVIVGPKSSAFPKRVVKGGFSYRGASYLLAITDPNMEAPCLALDDGQYRLQDPVICLSMSDPFGDGFLYKLIAAIFYKGMLA